MENLTAQAWALQLSAKSYKTILVLCPSSRPRSAELPFLYDCPFHIKLPPKVCNPHSFERHSGIVAEWFLLFSSKIVRPRDLLRVRIRLCMRRRIILAELVFVSRGEIGIFR